jgi:alkanesulfonate monooxygenase SsuD/methylene tetrahydromethanopterin reductase-like flavin-dependent oxidoreductase (luciferase family)
MTYDPGPRRVDRLEEAVPLVKRLLAGETVTHSGDHYRLEGASVGVVAVQRPRPRLAIGAGGPRMLRLAAREADIVGLTPGFNMQGRPILRQASEGATAEKVALVKEAAGDRFANLELNIWLAGAGLAGRGGPRLGLVAAAGWALTSIYASPYVLYGTLSSVRERLLRRRDRLGISYYTIPGGAMESMAPLVEALTGR